MDGYEKEPTPLLPESAMWSSDTKTGEYRELPSAGSLIVPMDVAFQH